MQKADFFRDCSIKPPDSKYIKSHQIPPRPDTWEAKIQYGGHQIGGHLGFCFHRVWPRGGS